LKASNCCHPDRNKKKKRERERDATAVNRPAAAQRKKGSLKDGELGAETEDWKSDDCAICARCKRKLPQ